MKTSFFSTVFWLSLFPFLFGQTTKSFYNGPLELFYEEQGSGPALYILSGGPGEAPEHPYRQIIDSLAPYYTCVLLHQRGSGKSKNIPINEKTINIKSYTQDIELVRQKRGDKQITLFGYSWGGLLAMNYAAEYPNNVASLMLIASAPPSYKLWNVLYDNQFSRRSETELDSMEALQKIFSAKTEKELDSLKTAAPNSAEVLAYKEFIQIHVRAMYFDRRKVSRPLYEKVFYDFNFQPIPIIDKEVLETKFDITEKLKKLSTPTLIIYGRQDDQGESTFYLQQESLKNNETYVIEQCGHEILEEQPFQFFELLLGYVKRKRL